MAPTDPLGPHEHQLSDGTTVVVRTIEPGDGPKLSAAFEQLSPESRHRRFFTAMPRLSESMLHHLLDVDGADRAAWVALDAGIEGQPGMGIARYYRMADCPHAAEMAVAVVDQYQNRGVGSLLLRHLNRTARAHGITCFVGTVLSENRPMLDLIDGAGGRYELEEPGVLRLEIDVPDLADDPDHPSEGGAARPGLFTLLRAAARWSDS